MNLGSFWVRKWFLLLDCVLIYECIDWYLYHIMLKKNIYLYIWLSFQACFCLWEHGFNGKFLLARCVDDGIINISAAGKSDILLINGNWANIFTAVLGKCFWKDNLVVFEWFWDALFGRNCYVYMFEMVLDQHMFVKLLYWMHFKLFVFLSSWL